MKYFNLNVNIEKLIECCFHAFQAMIRCCNFGLHKTNKITIFFIFVIIEKKLFVIKNYYFFELMKKLKYKFYNQPTKQRKNIRLVMYIKFKKK